jgi:hypothetical protein
MSGIEFSLSRHKENIDMEKDQRWEKRLGNAHLDCI